MTYTHTYRLLHLLTSCALLSVVCAACETTTVPQLVISGTLSDSIASRRLAGYVIRYGLDSAVTDSVGEFAIVVSPRADTLSVDLASSVFQPFAAPLSGQRDTVLTIRLNRLVAYVTSFAVGPNGRLEATLVNVRGLDRIARDNSTWVVYFSPTMIQSSAIPADQWTWQQLDPRTGRVSVVTGDLGITGARWLIADIGGGGVMAECTGAQPTCTDSAR